MDMNTAEFTFLKKKNEFKIIFVRRITDFVQFIKMLARNKLTALGALFIFSLVVVAIFAPWAWDIHTEGTQPAVRAVTDALDRERIALREALGLPAPHYPLADHYLTDQWMYGDAHRQLQKSGDWREHIDLATHRYITEDTELGLAFLASVARWAGVDAPVAHGLLAIVGAFLGRDLRAGARTLESLGLAGLTRSQLAQVLHDGE